MGTVILVALIFGLLAGFGGTVLALWANADGKLAAILPGTMQAQDTPAPTFRPVLAAPGGKEAAPFADVASMMNESVVNINTSSVRVDPYAMFFGRGAQEVKGMGTGMIVNTDGHILTNYHVVGDAQKIKVTVMRENGRYQEYDAKFIAGDRQEDLAVIQIKAKGLKPARFGNSDALRPGDWVMAIGNPFGFEHTVSAGVVSALNRNLPVDDSRSMRGLVQTDVSISPGNSGGPLVDLQGNVVGINTLIYVSRGGQPQGGSISFSIPSNRAKQVMTELLTRGKVAHPYLGVRYKEITEDVRRDERLPVKYGCLVQGVYPGGPAAKGGVLPGDIITSINGEPMNARNALSDFIGKQQVGKSITLEVKRWDDGRGDWTDKILNVKIGDMPNEFVSSMHEEAQPQQQPQPQMPRERGLTIPLPF